MAPNEPNAPAAGAACMVASNQYSTEALQRIVLKNPSTYPTPKPVLPKAGVDAGAPNAGVDGCPNA